MCLPREIGLHEVEMLLYMRAYERKGVSKRHLKRPDSLFPT